MSGHSKWANIKHKKGKADAARGKITTKIGREITIAVQMGGPDPVGNMRLKLALAKAKANNIPKDNIKRAIAKGAGETNGAKYEEITYEGYGPAGVAIMLDVLTDNRNRAAADIRHAFTKHGGNMGETGSVGWMFKRKGIFTIDKEAGYDEDEVMMIALDAGAEDMKSNEDSFEIVTQPEDYEPITILKPLCRKSPWFRTQWSRCLMRMPKKSVKQLICLTIWTTYRKSIPTLTCRMKTTRNKKEQAGFK